VGEEGRIAPLEGLFGSFEDSRRNQQGDRRQVSSRESLLTSIHPDEYVGTHFSACLSTATRHCGSKLLRGPVFGGYSSAHGEVQCRILDMNFRERLF
jgi:hypothetical protein